jgi:3-oxoacyl-(acyl-carrier-protein) synthase
MRLALADAQVAADDVAAVMATANGSPQLDRLEADAIHEVFGGRAVPVASIKGAIGESGAAGAASLVAGLLSLSKGVVTLTTGLRDIDPGCRVHASAAAQPSAGDLFLVNSVASGGTHYSLVVRTARV